MKNKQIRKLKQHCLQFSNPQEESDWTTKVGVTL